jgi:3',5'-cyclic-nucleotide phosphodiesterase
LATAVNRCEQGDLKRIQFSRGQLRELRYAALLHDFGKVGVREHVLIKGKKLYQSQLENVQTRVKFFQARLEAQAYRGLVDQHGELGREEFRLRRAAVKNHLDEEMRRLQDFLAMIEKANEPSILESELPPELLAAVAYRINDDQGASFPLLTELELQALTLAKGSLTPSERKDIQSHVSHTYAFLKHIPWTGALAAVPDIAHAHHEKLDGTGYPRGLRGDEIPLQSRIMTIADIFDALTAGDRPYKHSLGIEQALDILREEGRNGKVEPLLVDVFIDSRAYQIIDVH